MIVDAHVRIGDGREVGLSVDELLATMDGLGIDRALISPAERHLAYDNREGNELTSLAAAASGGRLLAYAVANPWRSSAAVSELDRARDAGAVALAVDPALQGFDLLDGLIDPLLDFAASCDWLVYVRTGTPHALPLPLATLARRCPELSFVMGRSGATDFWIDAAPALRYAPNLYGDTAYAPWDTVLAALRADPEIGPSRLVFSTDAPYTVPSAELARITDWPLDDEDRSAILGGTITDWSSIHPLGDDGFPSPLGEIHRYISGLGLVFYAGWAIPMRRHHASNPEVSIRNHNCGDRRRPSRSSVDGERRCAGSDE